MNILFFTSNSPYTEINTNKKSIGGAEINLRLIAEEFAKLDHNVFYYSNKKGMPIKKYINGVLTYHSPLFYIPVIHKKISFIRDINKKLIFIQQKKHLKDICKKNKIDIIHTYSTYPDSFITIKAVKNYNIPIVQRIVGRAWYNLLKNNPDLNTNIKWTFNNVNLLLFITDFIKDQTFNYFLNLGFKIKTPWSLMDIGVDFNQIKNIDTEKVKVKYNLSDNENIIICIASFKYYSKRQDILIKASPELIKKFNNLRIIFLGDGPNLEKMKRLAKDLKVLENIRFLGTVPHNDALGMISIAKVIVHPTDFEGYSNILKESFSLGKALVASDIRPLNDIVIDGHNGMLAENNPKMFGEKIAFLLNNGDIRESIEKNAAKYAEENFDSKKNIYKYKKLFLDIVSKKNGK